jgi:hypothetical protein
MNRISGRFRLEHLLGILLLVLVASAVIADLDIEHRMSGVLDGDVVRWVVAATGILTLGLLARRISSQERSRRSHHSFTLAWAVGQVTVIGLVQTLPTAPTLETLQAVDLHSLDPFAQAALQWGAAWSAAVLVTFVFAGPRLNAGWGILVWLLGVVSSDIVSGTLPEDSVPPLVLLPIAAVWAALVFIGIVYGVPSAAAASADGVHSARHATRPVNRAVWASLALVLLSLVVAEFQAFVALDLQVNADRTVTQKAMDAVASRIDKVDQSLTATTKAVRTNGDIKSSIDRLENAIADVGDQVGLAVETQQLPSTTVVARADEVSVAVQRVQKANEDLQAMLQPLHNLNPDTDADQLTTLLSRDVARSTAQTRREANLARQVLIGNELPTAGVFLWVAAIYAALVLLPWVLFVLFLLQKRESSARESLIDLCLLDGLPAPPRRVDAAFGEIPPGSLLDRVLGESFQHPSHAPQSHAGPTVGQVQRALVERAFSEPEYLIGLAMLSAVIAAGWYMVFYPQGGIGLANTIIQGADAAHLWSYLLSGLNPLTAAFAGAYFWCAYALVRRYLDSDLYPAAFLQCAVQFVLALVLALMVAIAVPPVASLAASTASFVGTTASSLGTRLTGASPSVQDTTPAALPQTPASPPNGPTSPAPVEAITILLAFVGGVSISAGFTQVLGLLRVLLQFIGLRNEKVLMDQPRLTELEGIDSWTEARFAEEGLDNVQALANAPLHRLVLHTHFTTPRLVDWVDQALLYVHTANWPTDADAADVGSNGRTTTTQSDGKSDLFRALRFAGIRTATDLLGAGGWLTEAGFVDLGDAFRRQQTLQRALSRVLTDYDAAYSAAIFTTCQALIDSPNWVHVANFRHAARELLGAHTRAWIESANPPVPREPAAPPGSNGLQLAPDRPTTAPATITTQAS